jgi:hypothetical protein
MELFTTLITVVGAFTIFAALSVAFGVDSRDSVGDDWAR